MPLFHSFQTRFRFGARPRKERSKHKDEKYIEVSILSLSGRSYDSFFQWWKEFRSNLRLYSHSSSQNCLIYDLGLSAPLFTHAKCLDDNVLLGEFQIKRRVQICLSFLVLHLGFSLKVLVQGQLVRCTVGATLYLSYLPKLLVTNVVPSNLS